MNENHDELAAELAALRPLDASAELRRRIANHRSVERSPAFRVRWGLAIAGGLAAVAAVLAAALLLPGILRRSGETAPIIVQVQPGPAVRTERAGATLLAYQQALAQSPEELEALLDKDALIPSESPQDRFLIYDYRRPDATLRNLLGED